MASQLDLMKMLTRIYGEAFLKYVLALDQNELVENLSPNGGQSQVLGFLHGQATSLPDDDPTGFTRHTTLAGLGSYIPEENLSFPNLLRRTSGGDDLVNPVPPTGDAVLDGFLEIIWDVWPIYLLPPPDSPPKTFWLASPIGVFQHPRHVALSNAILADESLAKIFCVEPDSATRVDDITHTPLFQGAVISTGGGGGGIQLPTLISNVISNGVFRALIGHEYLEWNRIADCIRDSVAAVRRMASGHTVAIPTLVGISGLSLSENARVDIANGTLRHATTPETQLLLPKTESLTAVFETTYPTKIRIGSAVDIAALQKLTSSTQSLVEEAQRSFRRSMDMLRMSLLLASSNDRPLLMNEVSRFVVDPFQPGGMQSWNPMLNYVESHPISDSQIDSAKEWHSLVEKKHPRTLDVGMRRLISATTTRVDVIDAFVDAVICWENMFGVRTETTFRVTGAIVKLIGEGNFDDRAALQRELKTLYEKRSALVHGGKEPSMKDLGNYRKRAIGIAVECFRKLYRDRPDLLEIESDARGARLLLE